MSTEQNVTKACAASGHARNLEVEKRLRALEAKVA